jgi:hypothetical protein
MRVHISAGLTSSTSDFSFRHIRPEYKKKPLVQGLQKVEHVVAERIVTPYRVTAIYMYVYIYIYTYIYIIKILRRAIYYTLFTKLNLDPVTHVLDLAVEEYCIVLSEDGPLRAEICRSDTVLIKWC